LKIWDIKGHCRLLGLNIWGWRPPAWRYGDIRGFRRPPCLDIRDIKDLGDPMLGRWGHQGTSGVQRQPPPLPRSEVGDIKGPPRTPGRRSGHMDGTLDTPTLDTGGPQGTSQAPILGTSGTAETPVLGGRGAPTPPCSSQPAWGGPSPP